MTITLNDVSARTDLVATAGQTVFAFTFGFFANSDLKVYKNAVLLGGGDYIAAGAGAATGRQITLATPASVGDAIAIVRAVPYERTAQLPLSGPFQVEALNVFLTKVVAMMQQLHEENARQLTLPASDPTVNMMLPPVADRVNRYLGFDANGAVQMAAIPISFGNFSQFMYDWLHALPTEPQVVVGWWNNAGTPAYS